MAQKGGVIRVNRAPVLTLWAAIVAERLGHDADAAITLGRAVAGSSARVKARAIGLEEKRENGGLRDAAKPAPQQTVHLLGRDLPVVERNGSPYALDHGKPASPASRQPRPGSRQPGQWGLQSVRTPTSSVNSDVAGGHRALWGGHATIR